MNGVSQKTQITHRRVYILFFLQYVQVFNRSHIYLHSRSVYFRAGVRRNNTDVIMASRVKLSTIYFGISKTNYQKIEIIDVITEVCAPPDVQTYFQ